MIHPSHLTFGCEHEFADIPRTATLPPGFGWDVNDNTIVNSNGIANDPKGKLYALGGEVNTPPSDSIASQVEMLATLKERFPQACVNYRSNLHVHVRVPGLKDSLLHLKRFAAYNAYWLPRILGVIEPIPHPEMSGGKVDDAEILAYLGEMRRYRRRKRSHHTVLTPERTERQLAARTVQEFFEAEVPRTANTGKPMWHAQPRAAVNLRQLLQTDTIEFRHFPGTLDEKELEWCIAWCGHYTMLALAPWDVPTDADPLDAYQISQVARFPIFPPYQHALEIRYRATCHDGTVAREQIIANIEAIEGGYFDDSAWEKRLSW